MNQAHKILGFLTIAFLCWTVHIEKTNANMIDCDAVAVETVHCSYYPDISDEDFDLLQANVIINQKDFSTISYTVCYKNISRPGIDQPPEMAGLLLRVSFLFC
jgi:hypothetical protein